jgi:hypothetical protein
MQHKKTIYQLKNGQYYLDRFKITVKICNVYCLVDKNI